MSRTLRELIAFAAAAWLCAPSAFSEGRSLRFSRLSLEHGLSQGAVNVILQDSRGLMWFGTQDGLNRFDGYRFRVFRHDLDDPESLPNNWIWSLYEDADGNVWVGTTNGLARWNRANGSFTQFRHDPSNPESLSNNNVRVLYGARGGGLWVGTDAGLNRYEPQSGRFTRFLHDPSRPTSLPADGVRSIVESRDGLLWVGTFGGGLGKLDPDSGRFETYRHDPASSGSLVDDRIRVIYEDRDRRLWIGTYEDGVDRFDAETATFQHLSGAVPGGGSTVGHRARAIYEDSQGTLWIGTDGGLLEWRPESDDFLTYRHDPADPASLSDDRVMSIFQDRGGVVWVGTQGGGLSRWNPLTDYFDRYRRNPTAPSSLTSDVIQAFSEDAAGNLWVGTYGGLNRMDRERGTVEHFRNEAGDPSSLSDSRVMSLLVDREGRLWVGTYQGGLNLFHPETRSFVRFRHDESDPRSLSADAVTSIYQTRAGVLWVGTFRGGLNRYAPATGGFTRFQNDPEDPASLGSDRVVTLHEDTEGRLWIGTDGGGLSCFDHDRFTTYRHDPGDPGSLGSNVVFSILEDATGVLWIGTQGGGLNRMERSDAGRPSFRRYGEREGLPNPTVNGILEDESGQLWVSTNRGLARFDPGNEVFKVYDASNGLQSDEFNQGAYYRSPSGEMFFGGNKGFNAFFPRAVRNNSHVPPVVLTSFLKFNRQVELDSPISELDEVQLGYHDFVVSFEFSALDYTAPEKNRYAYMLEGFDEEWIDLGELHRVTFTNLDPGRYVLRVRGSNNDSVWNKEGLRLGVQVLPPPWRTWWAYTLYVALLAGLVWAYARSQARKLRREAEYSRELEREVEMRTRELAERNEELERANDQLQRASETDALTGLRNRRFLIKNIERDVALATRYYRNVEPGRSDPPESRPDLQFLLFDLDGFKEVNDRCGHAAGDKVLLQVRDILHSVCRQTDTLIRWGGDEFLIVARHAERQTPSRLAERIRRAVSEHPFDVGLEEPVRLSASVGFADYPFVASRPGLFNWEQVVAIADGALYLAKRGGRNAWVGAFGTEKASEAAPESFVKWMKVNPDRLLSERMVELKSSVEHPTEMVF